MYGKKTDMNLSGNFFIVFNITSNPHHKMLKNREAL